MLDLTKRSYTKAAFAETTDELIHNAEMQLIGQGIDFDSMVGIGNSGLLVLPILARHFKVPFFAMRKRGIMSHNSAQPDGDGIIGKRWILIDDVKVTGSTISYAREIIGKLAFNNNYETQYQGTYLYEPMTHTPGEFLYPDCSIKSVQAISTANGIEYVTYGIYAKMVELADYIGLDNLVATVFQRFPYWDAQEVNKIKDSLCS